MNTRWLGGTLTNFATIKSRVDRMRQLESLLEKPESLSQYTKKEQLELSREHDRLRLALWGIRDLKRVPDVLFIVDPRKERIAVLEANRLNIPVIGVTDTNCDPSQIDFVIPSNDDSLRAIALFTGAIANAIINGRAALKDKRGPEAAGGAEEGFMADKDAGEGDDSKKPGRRRPARPRSDRGGNA